jgi:hypothetical protein
MNMGDRGTAMSSVWTIKMDEVNMTGTSTSSGFTLLGGISG